MEDVIQKYKDHIVDPKTQQKLNEPLKDDTGFNKGHEEFLKMLIKKLEDKELDPHNIQTLYNKDVYEKLSEEDSEAADLTAVNIMGVIRQIEKLWELEKHALSKAEGKPTFQVQNLCETVFQMKSKFEEKHGDVYII
jgi:hypothetical protein